MGQATLRLGGRDYEGWHAIAVRRGLEQAASQFEVRVSERTTGQPFEPWVLRPGAPCEILLDGEVVITGYIDTYAPSFNADTHDVHVSGRSRTADFVDGAAIVPGGQFKQLSLWEIAERLAQPFGLTVTGSAGMPVVEGPRPSGDFVGPMPGVTPTAPVEGPRPSPDFVGPMPPLQDVQVQQGETCYALLERLARLQGLLIADTATGQLALTRVGSRRAVGALVQGDNILSASATLDASQRYSEYTVKGQRPNTDDREDGSETAPAVGGGRQTQASGGGPAGPSVRACIGAALDGFLGRYKPWLLTAETIADDLLCQQRADWEARRRAGHAVRATITVAGWRQTARGPLWDVNLLVPVIAPWLGINRELLIASVAFQKDDSGSTTTLELTLPDAFATEADGVPSGASATGGDAGGGSDLWSSGSISTVVKAAGGIFL